MALNRLLIGLVARTNLEAAFDEADERLVFGEREYGLEEKTLGVAQLGVYLLCRNHPKSRI